MDAQNKEAAALVKRIASLHSAISKLPSLSPSPEVDALFTALVAACVPPSPVHVATLRPKVQRMRDELVRFCAEAEARLEAHCSDALAALDDPLHHLRLFPYYDSYVGLSDLEHGLLSRHAPDRLAAPTRVAFLGSGSLPLSSLLLAARHMQDAVVDSFDRCGEANDRARRLLLRGDDGGVATRMSFRTADVEGLTRELAAYDVVFLAASVGVEAAEEKARVIAHLGEHMADGAALVVRSAHGARGFLCPVVEPADVVRGGFQVLAVHHPHNDEVMNSIIVARKVAGGCNELAPAAASPPCKCCEVETPRRRLPPTSCHLDAMDEIRRRAW
jgi:nicotianamine synthase